MNKNQRIEEARRIASLMMHKHYCEHDTRWIIDHFAMQISWFGAGEEEYLTGRDNIITQFREFKEGIPDCTISDEEYEVICPAENMYVVSGRMWIATNPDTGMYLKVHQRVTFVLQDTEDGMKCVHIHCSNPYQEMVEGEIFPEKIGRQSFDYVQERLTALEEEIKQQNRQLEVIMSSIAGGLKISNDDDTYSFAFVSKEAAALFGYTVEEFMEVTGGTAVGTVYPPDLDKALADCAEAFRDGGLTYSTRYRVRCRDGSLKWVMDSGKKAQDVDGRWMVNSLYLDITRTEEDAQRLREQTELLTSIYDTVPCGIIRFVQRNDGVSQLISLNKATVSLMGYRDIEEGVNDWHDGVLGAVLEEDQQKIRAHYSKLHQTGDRQDLEYRVKWKDGSIHWMDGTSMIVGMTAEKELIIQRTVVDITPRKNLQQRLNREQDLYRVAMEASAAVMFEYLMDTDTFISYEPQAGGGVVRHELNRYSEIILDEQIVHPDDAPKVLDNICHGRSEVFDVRCTTPGGERGKFIWFRVNCRLITEEGRPARVVGALQNIHSMKSKLFENSERLYMNQSALQAINDVYISMFYVDLFQDNYYAVRMPEVNEGDILPRRGSFTEGLRKYILHSINQDDLNRVAEICQREWLLNKLTGKNEHTEVEFRHQNPDLWLRLEIYPVSIENGKPRTIIIAFRNISEEKQRELEYYEEEKRAKAALEEAYHSLDRANRAKSDFLSRMSHDIRTPMNAIMGMTAIAEKNIGSQEKIEDCLQKISLSGAHLLELINEVLDMSKIESGNVGLNEEPIRLTELLEDVSQIIQPEAGSKKQHFSVSVKKMEHNAVRGDAARVKQVLLNLLSNAVKYTGEEGNISICLEEKLSSESGVGCYEIIVEDDGIGMTKEFQEKLFLPFERAEDPRVGWTQGTGLGLAITRNLVQMMNGTIQVESEINRGTKFIVTIYLQLVPETEDGSVPCSQKPDDMEYAFEPGTRVLLAEDNLLNQEIVKELLDMYGIEVVCAANGQEAADLFETNPPGTYDLILMDIQMPVLNGYEATEVIRKSAAEGRRPDAADIPIIALTANAFADDVYRAKKAGLNEHVMKPIEVDHLISVMHHYLDRK